MDDVNVGDIAPQPNVPVEFVPAKGGDIFKLGGVTVRIMEDGSNTAQRLGTAEFTIPGGTAGPPAHWHEMHDETFLITQGTIRFHIYGEDAEKTIDANVGDYVVVPIRSPHTFSNPSDQEAKFFNTFTPSFYINYFKLMATMGKPGERLTKAQVQKAMSYYATLPAKLSG